MVSYHDLSDEEKDRLYHRRPRETPRYDQQMIVLIIAATVIVALIALLSYGSSLNSTRIDLSSPAPVTTPQ
jgi:hypothetical protein